MVMDAKQLVTIRSCDEFRMLSRQINARLLTINFERLPAQCLFLLWTRSICHFLGRVVAAGLLDTTVMSRKPSVAVSLSSSLIQCVFLSAWDDAPTAINFIIIRNLLNA